MQGLLSTACALGRALAIAVAAIALATVVALGIPATAGAQIDAQHELGDDALGGAQSPEPCEDPNTPGQRDWSCWWPLEFAGSMRHRLGVIAEALAALEEAADRDFEKVTVLPAKLDGIAASVDALGPKLDAIVAALEADEGGDEQEPADAQLVALSDDDRGLVRSGFVAQQSALWYLIGALVAGMVVQTLIARVWGLRS